jgi:hypothetical protein
MNYYQWIHGIFITDTTYMTIFRGDVVEHSRGCARPKSLSKSHIDKAIVFKCIQ